MLTATFVVKHSTGNDVSKIGSGNPGMANVMEHIGKKEGVLVLAGDILKVIVAGILGRLLFPEKHGMIFFYIQDLERFWDIIIHCGEKEKVEKVLQLPVRG
ncbi:MAG: glycerol-3-phosphate acyltransferase [Roseburia sp.]|nr:glycerol-3-phosphate acyltransferase [Roseburia sp.]